MRALFRTFAAFVGAAVALGVILGLNLIKERRAIAEISGPVHIVAQTLIEKRCARFIASEADHLPHSGFVTAGLVETGMDGEHMTFTTPDEGIVVKLQIVGAKVRGCIVGDESKPWSAAERQRIETIATAFGPAWVGEPMEAVDLRDRSGFDLHRIYRPRDGEGRFLMIVSARVDGGRDYSFVSVGTGTFEQGDTDA